MTRFLSGDEGEDMNYIPSKPLKAKDERDEVIQEMLDIIGEDEGDEIIPVLLDQMIRNNFRAVLRSQLEDLRGSK